MKVARGCSCGLVLSAGMAESTPFHYPFVALSWVVVLLCSSGTPHQCWLLGRLKLLERLTLLETGTLGEFGSRPVVLSEEMASLWISARTYWRSRVLAFPENSPSMALSMMLVPLPAQTQQAAL